MQPLDTRPFEDQAPQLIDLLTLEESEVDRQLHICNACRYCEGFCAVFPAMTRRLEFARADVHYLANLCHNCGACLHACQYAPPHEFAVNIPQAMAKVRGQTYAHYAWPAAFGRLYQRNGLTLASATAGGLALFLLLALAVRGTLFPGPLAGNFYAIFPHNLLALMFGGFFALVALALAIGVARFWRGISPPTAPRDPVSPLAAGVETVDAVLRLKYLDPGLQQRKRQVHPVAPALPPPDLLRLSAVLRRHLRGHALSLLAGLGGPLSAVQRAGPARHRRRSRPGGRPARPAVAQPAARSATGRRGAAPYGSGLHPAPAAGQPQRPGPVGRRDSGAMAALLAIHLGAVMAFFLTMPYGKFAHGIFRSAALLKHAIEKRQPDRLRLGAD